MERTQKNQNYLERSRNSILNMGYDFVAYKSRMRKSLITIKKIILNNAYHFEEV